MAPYVADFDVCNCGTIPIKVWVDNLAITMNGGNDYLDYGILATADGGQTYISPNSYQLEPTKCLHIAIWFTIDEADRGYGTALSDVANQGLTGTITGTLTGMQWNEEPAGY